MSNGPSIGALNIPEESVPLSMLRSIPLFSRIPEEELRTVAAGLQVESFSAGQSIVTEGDLGDACYLVSSGQAGVISRSHRARGHPGYLRPR